MLPICNNKPISFLNSLFMATSGICVNGFTSVTISEQFNIIGQVVLLILTQIGALGFMSVIIYILTLKNKKINFFNTILAGDSINENIYSNVKQRAKHICMYTFMIELVGAVFLSVKFIPMYGYLKGAWYSIFHSVTAFCNTSFDLFGNSSLTLFRNDIYLNLVFMILIILGGIGFFVIEDFLMCKRKKFRNLKFQSKIVILSTTILLVVSVLLIKIFEPDFTLLESMFASVTVRTAGFFTRNIAYCNDITKIILVILMFIGGAPGSTSGGIRIVVFAVLVLTTIATLRNKKDVIVFSKKITTNQIKKAIAIFVSSIGIILISVILMYYLDNIGTFNNILHCVSAFSATGLGTIEISNLNVYGKMILMLLMFIGRVGPLCAISLFLIDRKKDESIDYPDGNLML